MERLTAQGLIPGSRHLEILESLLAVQPSVRLVTDAHIAAIAIEHGLELSSRDRGFTRWAEQGLRSRDPIAEHRRSS